MELVWLNPSHQGTQTAVELRRLSDILGLIAEEELLEALPDCQIARARHLTALRLLDEGREHIKTLLGRHLQVRSQIGDYHG